MGKGLKFNSRGVNVLGDRDAALFYGKITKGGLFTCSARDKKAIPHVDVYPSLTIAHVTGITLPPFTS